MNSRRELIRLEQQVQVDLAPLTEGSIEGEILGLREDMLNWDHGHPMSESEMSQ